MRLITKTAELAAFCEELAAHEYVAVDTEFMRESTYWPDLCLIQLAGATETLQLLTVDNIPTQFKVVPQPDASPELLNDLAANFKEQLPKIEAVAFPSKQIEVLATLRGFIGLRLYLITGFLLLSAVLLIWNTIRTAMFARRREIEVMKLVGATNWFIRVPFMLEGW